MSRTRSRSVVAPLLVLAALGVSLGLLARPGQSAQDKKVTVKDGWDGDWSVVSVVANGEAAPADRVKALQFTFQGEKLSLSMLGKTKEGTIKLDPGKNPPQFELHVQGQRPNRGIYRLTKDTLTLCFSERGAPPKEFKSEAGTPNILIVLKRGAVKLDAAEAKRLRDKIEFTTAKARSSNNLKQIALAMHGYHDTYKHLPTPAIYSKDGKPLLSWRVTILPYIEQAPLYKLFHLDEPWDSAHNKKLLEAMPEIYAPVRGKTKQPHATYYQVFVGPGTAFEGNTKIGLLKITDGTSNTVMVAEAGEAVPWTKPEDLRYSAKRDLPKLGGLFPDGLYVGFCDGSVRWMSRPFDAQLFRLAITRNDGQDANLDKLFP